MIKTATDQVRFLLKELSCYLAPPVAKDWCFILELSLWFWVILEKIIRVPYLPFDPYSVTLSQITYMIKLYFWFLFSVSLELSIGYWKKLLLQGAITSYSTSSPHLTDLLH